MALHKYTPYQVTAERLNHRGKDGAPRLELAALGGDQPVDLLDALEANLVGLPPINNQAKTQKMRCVDVRRSGDYLHMVFAHDYSGERELVLDVAEGEDGGEGVAKVVFLKEDQHVARIYSCCTVWRPSSPADDPCVGVLLIHSPWGRAGSRSMTGRLLQKALRAHDPAPKAKLKLDALVTDAALQNIINTADATRIRYTKSKRLRSSFANPDGGHQSVESEMSLVVKGADATPFRDALRGALRSADKRSSLFTVEIRDGEAFEEETFDDVEVTFTTGSGNTTYSLKKDNVPTMGYDLSSDVQSVYAILPPEERGDNWPRLILDGLVERLQRLATEVSRGLKAPDGQDANPRSPDDDAAVV